MQARIGKEDNSRQINCFQLGGGDEIRSVTVKVESSMGHICSGTGGKREEVNQSLKELLWVVQMKDADYLKKASVNEGGQ